MRTRWGILPRVEPKELVCIRLLFVKSGGGGGERKVGVVSSWVLGNYSEALRCGVPWRRS